MTVQKKVKMTCEEKRKLLDSFGGKFYHLEWLKAGGIPRQCTAQHMQHKMFAEGHASKAHVSTVAHKPNLYTCVDTTNHKWVNVNLEALKRVRCGSVDIEFED